jgi:protein-S-isoprenylcysteine O-methyltransferase Ste14
MKSVFLRYALPAYFIYLTSYGPLYLLVYKLHPYYIKLISPQTMQVLTIYFWLFVIGGLPYFMFNGMAAPRERDKLRRLLASLRVMGTHRKIEPIVRLHLLKILVKGFYAPLMLNYMFFHLGQVTRLYGNPASFPNSFDYFYQLVFSSIFFVDTAIFAFGYLVETHWLDNSIKSIEPTLFGWVAALSVYEPFFGITSQFFPLTRQNPLVLPGTVLYGFKLAALAAYAVYGWATVALLFKASNLTNRGIVTWGPYKYLRHPAYVGKNIAWWLEMVPYLNHLPNIIFLLGINFIYYLRAITEERHLGLDPAYRAYKKVTRF